MIILYLLLITLCVLTFPLLPTKLLLKEEKEDLGTRILSSFDVWIIRFILLVSYSLIFNFSMKWMLFYGIMLTIHEIYIYFLDWYHFNQTKL